MKQVLKKGIFIIIGMLLLSGENSLEGFTRFRELMRERHSGQSATGSPGADVPSTSVGAVFYGTSDGTIIPGEMAPPEIVTPRGIESASDAQLRRAVKANSPKGVMNALDRGANANLIINEKFNTTPIYYAFLHSWILSSVGREAIVKLAEKGANIYHPVNLPSSQCRKGPSTIFHLARDRSYDNAKRTARYICEHNKIGNHLKMKPEPCAVWHEDYRGHCPSGDPDKDLANAMINDRPMSALAALESGANPNVVVNARLNATPIYYAYLHGWYTKRDEQEKKEVIHRKRRSRIRRPQPTGQRVIEKLVGKGANVYHKVNKHSHGCSLSNIFQLAAARPSYDAQKRTARWICEDVKGGPRHTKGNPKPCAVWHGKYSHFLSGKCPGVSSYPSIDEQRPDIQVLDKQRPHLQEGRQGRVNLKIQDILTSLSKEPLGTEYRFKAKDGSRMRLSMSRRSRGFVTRITPTGSIPLSEVLFKRIESDTVAIRSYSSQAYGTSTNTIGNCYSFDANQCKFVKAGMDTSYMIGGLELDVGPRRMDNIVEERVKAPWGGLMPSLSPPLPPTVSVEEPALPVCREGQAYYDGCNQCRYLSSGSMCTKRACTGSLGKRTGCIPPQRDTARIFGRIRRLFR